MGFHFVVVCDGPGCQERLTLYYEDLGDEMRERLARHLLDHASCPELQVFCDQCEPAKPKASG